MGNKKRARCIDKAYSDYMYTRNMMETDGEAGLEDLASTPLRYLKQHGKLDKLEDTDGKGNYAVKINVNVSGENEPWLLMLGNNDSLESALRDSFSERSVPYAAMRVSGGGSPLEKAEASDSEGGNGPKEAAVKAAEDFSSFAAQAGIPTGLVSEMYHPAFADSRMETAAVISATPAVNMRKDEFSDDDILLLIEDAESERAAYFRKLRRFMSSGEPKRMVKALSFAENGDFVIRIGAEYAEAFEAAAEEYGLSCTAFTESAPDAEVETVFESGAETAEISDWNEFETKAETGDSHAGNVTEPEAETDAVSERTVYKEAAAGSIRSGNWNKGYIACPDDVISFTGGMRRIAEDLNTCSARGLIERFDSTVGSGAGFMPLGGINQLSPVQAMVNKIPVNEGNTDDCSVLAWGGNPYIAEDSSYHAAYLAVVESISKLVATGASFNEIYLSLYANSADEETALEALLGAFEAEMGLGTPAVNVRQTALEDGGKTPLVLSFAATMGKASELISPEFKGAGRKVVMLVPETDEDTDSAYYGMPTPQSLKELWRKAYELIANGRASAAYAPGIGGIAEAVMKMSYGNGVGFEYIPSNIDWGDDANSGPLTNNEIFGYSYGSIILEMTTDDPVKSRTVNVREIGRTTRSRHIVKDDEALGIGELMMLYEGKLESVYPSHADTGISEIGNLAYSARSWPTPIFKRAAPKVLIPVVPGCIGEADAARAVTAAGGKAEILLVGSSEQYAMEKSAERLADAIGNTQVILLSDGYAGGAVDTAEITTNLFKDEAVREALESFLDKKDGLMAGIGEGFKALINLGLVPFGKITDEDGAALSEGPLSGCQSRIARVRVASNKSPWLRSNKPGEIYSLPVAGTGGRFTASDELMNKLAVNGQIATQYVDTDGNASLDVRFNPSGSALAIEAVTSPDGRIIGRTGHAERIAEGLYRNVPGVYLSDMFENAVRYFK